MTLLLSDKVASITFSNQYKPKKREKKTKKPSKTREKSIYTIYRLMPNDAMTQFPVIESFLKTYDEHNALMTKETIFDKIRRGQMTVFYALKKDKKVGQKICAMAICRLLPCYYGTYCQIFWLEGTGLKDWKHLMSDIEAWAKFHNCEFVEFAGRRGFERYFSKDYDEWRTLYRKPLKKKG